MKYLNSLLILLLILVVACEKEDPAPRQTEQEILKGEISKALTAQSDLSEFAAALEDLDLSLEDVANGITAFAPPDGTTGGRIKSVTALTPEILKGHIVKGLINATDLVDGDILKALDGRDLEVSVDGETISINGVPITAKGIVKGSNYIIHKVTKVIEDRVVQQPASLTVTVYNTLGWSPENLSGTPDDGATVSLYAAREDYPNGTPAYTGQTDAAGKIIFADVESGTTYYVVAEKGDMSNIINLSAETLEGKYTGFIPDGLFQTQEELETHAFQPGAELGNFRWMDLNHDGIINNADRGFVPHQEVTSATGNTVVEVLIGYENNGANIIRDGTDAQTTLQSARNVINYMHKMLAMTDGILSDDAACVAGTDWCSLDNFTFTAAHPTLLKIWNDGYNAIGQLNLLMRDVPALSFPQQDVVVSQAKALRAYVYLQLSNYFGGVPIMEGIRMEEDASRATIAEVRELILMDLEGLAGQLPIGSSGNRYQVSEDAAKVMRARVALLKQDYATVEVLATEVIEAARYVILESPDAVFADSTNAEMVWDISGTFPPGFKDYFYGRSFVPEIRFAELYLMLAESQVVLGKLENAKTTINVLRDRHGMTLAAGTTPDQVMTEIREVWHPEMSREGDRYLNLVRWGLASSVLSGQGYQDMTHSLLPIPQEILNKHYNLFQNPGY